MQAGFWTRNTGEHHPSQHQNQHRGALCSLCCVTALMLPDSRCRYHVQGNCSLMMLCSLDMGHSTKNLHRAYSEHHQQPASVLQPNKDHPGLGLRAGECCLLLSKPAKVSQSTTEKAGGPAALLGLILCRKATQAACCQC